MPGESSRHTTQSMHPSVMAYAIPSPLLPVLILAFWGLRIFFLTILVITAFTWREAGPARRLLLTLIGLSALLLLVCYLLLDSQTPGLASGLFMDVSLFTFCPPVIVLPLLLLEKKPS